MVVGVRVESENIQTGVVKHCNSSYFTMIAKDESGQNVEVPGLILDSVDSVRRFLRSIKRQEQGRARSNEFRSEDFNVEDHLSLFESKNAIIRIT